MTVVFAALVIFTFTGCAADDNTTATTTTTTTGTQATTASYTISFTKISVFHGSRVMATSDTNLPDGTKLRSQLYYQAIYPFAWWPNDQDIEVIGGKWEIKMPFGLNGAPEDLPWETVHFRVWAKTNPRIEAFDMDGLFLPVS